MIYSFAELQTKDIINIENGENLGFIDDVIFESGDRQIKGFVIFGRKIFYGLLGRRESIVVNCKEIKLIGKDVILVKFDNVDCMVAQSDMLTKAKSLLKSTICKLLKKM